MMASRNPSSSSGAQQPDNKYIFRFQLAHDKLKKVDLPVPDTWSRAVDKSSVLVASLDAKITNTRALLFCSKLPHNLYKCVLGVKSGFLLVYSDSRSGYAFDLTSTTKITLRRDDKEKSTKTVLKWRFCELAIYFDDTVCPTDAGRLPLDALISAFTVQRCSDDIRVLCRRRPPADSTATQALPEVTSDVYEPCDGVVMPIRALPPTSPAQQELHFSAVFPVSREQLDAVQLFLSNAGASYDQDAVLSASLHISLSSRSAGDGAKVDNDDDDMLSDASCDADNNSDASAAE